MKSCLIEIKPAAIYCITAGFKNTSPYCLPRRVLWRACRANALMAGTIFTAGCGQIVQTTPIQTKLQESINKSFYEIYRICLKESFFAHLIHRFNTSLFKIERHH